MSIDYFTIGICLQVYEGCQTNFKFEPKEGFEKFSETDLRQLTEIQELTLIEEPEIENDDHYPDISKLKITTQ